jgi:fibronectin-binding autotransporter adhesin
MKKNRNVYLAFALGLAMAPVGLNATTFFTDNFSNGSTTNLLSVPGGTPTASFTSYDIASTKSTIPGTNGVSIAAGDLRLALAAATSTGWVEAQALFTTNPVALSAVNDYIEFTIVFTNTGGTLLMGGGTSGIWMGLFNSGSVSGVITNYPVAGGLAQAGLTGTAGSAYATGNCANWQGYASQVTSNLSTSPSRIVTRPIQNNGNTTSANQELLGNNAGTGAYNFPGGAVLTASSTPAIALTAGGQYTMQFRITLTAVNTLVFSNALYNGSGTGGAVVFSQMTTNISGANFLTANFDGLGIGVFNKGATIDPMIDIASLQITGQSTAVTGPPTITQQPVSVTVATNGSCLFSVNATGFGVTYQWRRNSTNLLNEGNISGATSSSLIISPAGTADAVSGANAYYVTVSGTGGYSTNSVTNSLVLVPATNLTWTASGGNIWDLNSTVAWKDNNGNPTVFNYGDPVTFDDSASLKIVNFSGNFLSAALVTVDTAINYTFQGSGSFAGLGSLLVKGSGQLTLNNANTFSGGTTVSNATAYVLLQNYNGLGTGPVTLAKAGGQMEIVPAGSASLGLNGDVTVADDFRMQIDGTGSYATVFFGDLSGTAGKTLTLDPKDLTTTNRIRAYGTATTMNANIVLNGPVTSQAQYNGTVLAAYGGSGSQVYNGVISGNGGFISRANGTTVFNGANTYSGGTTPTAGAIGFGIDSVGTTPDSGPIGTGPLNLAPEVPNTTGSGQVYASGGAHTIANPIQYPSATNNQTLIVGGTNNLTFTGSFALNGQDATGTLTARILQITNLGLTTFSGVISDGGLGYSLTKTGTGALALNNAETYTGPTTNSAGTLQINGSLVAASVVTVNSNATLSGTGTINGAVVINSLGTLAPGAAAIGTLTINNNLTLGGNVAARVNRAGFVSDKTIVSGVLTNIGSGIITVTNLGAALQAGDTFALFSKAVSNSVALVVSGAGVNWTNKLAVDGTIAVLSIITTTPPYLTNSITGSVLNFSWGAGYLGYHMEVQTNSLSTGLGTNWVTVPGTTTVTATNFTINPANGSVFYRLHQ